MEFVLGWDSLGFEEEKVVYIRSVAWRRDRVASDAQRLCSAFRFESCQVCKAFADKPLPSEKETTEMTFTPKMAKEMPIF